jgi:hypothetical protein
MEGGNLCIGSAVGAAMAVTGTGNRGHGRSGLVRKLAGCQFPFLLMLIAGCAAPSTATPAPEGDSASATAAQEKMPPPDKAPPMGGPLPAERVPSPVPLDTACTVDADCAVKDVGSCCGAMPACVHKDSPTDPAAVQAECARRGLASTCGFREITACTCSDGRCRDASGAGVVR